MDARAGTVALPEDLIDVDALVAAYYDRVPDVDDPAQQVVFGTSGHRGSSLDGAFNEAHIIAITTAIVEYRRGQGFDGPLFIGRDTHGLSLPAWRTALEVLAAAGVHVQIDSRASYTPTPAVSHAILRHNGAGTLAGVRTTGTELADGLVVTRLPRLTLEVALAAESTGRHDFLGTYVDDLATVLDLDAVRGAGVRIGADPLGGASVEYWGAIGERYALDLTVVNPNIDPRLAFMTLDWDGKIRMDCSSPYAMASLVTTMSGATSGRPAPYDIATGNDADADRHGIVTPDAGLMNPNHYLAVAISYLYGGARSNWPASAAVGKTLVSSALIDRVAASLGRRLLEVPVGFKWFVPGLLDASVAFGGEESAGASFLRRDGSVWTTDKDGILLALLASEIQATTGRSPSQLHADLVSQFGESWYARVDAPATRAEKATLAALTPDRVTSTTLAGEPITATLTAAPGNGAAIGGLKVTTEKAWFAARPSGTEDVYKIYAESFVSAEHLTQVQDAARQLVSDALA